MTPDFDRLVITGAGGWLGRAALSLAGRWWGDAAPERVLAFGSTGGEVQLQNRLFKVLPLTSLNPEIFDNAVILHFAFLTKDRLLSCSGEDFLARNAAIDSIVLNAARKVAPRGLFVASSGAANLVEQGGGDLYGLAKLVQERRFAELADVMDGVILRGRIWSLAGPHMNKPQAYALADFLIQGRRTGRIHVNATQPVYRSYLHVEDLVSLTIFALTHGRAPRNVVDLASMEVLEMQDVATAAARALGIKHAHISRPPIDLGRRNVYVGDWAPFRELALACNTTLKPFADQVTDTLAYFDSIGT